MARLRGRVFTGLGEGEFYVNLYARQFEKALGYKPFPGTLNIRLVPESVEEWRKTLASHNCVVVDPPSIPGARLARVKCYEAVLKGIRVHIVVPDISAYDESVVEVIAPENLREKLSLKDGDLVEILVPNHY